MSVHLAAAAGVKLAIKHVSHEEVYGEDYEEIPRRVPDVGRTERTLGWRPELSLEDMLQRTIDSVKRDADSSGKG
ncbi:hypothetical protein [Rubrobacter aplysinae]|uniref:hypothetical protein n=1 Tax=Rubrobacter aplysinae TaxID=909625 RepID=UPI00064C1C55|nr:hypothetical protein [Rubrobacter aplysinae]